MDRQPCTFRAAQIRFSDGGLPSYLLPLSPREICVSGSSCKRQEICNDGKGLIAAHWILSLIFCVAGLRCCARAFRQVGDEPSIDSYIRYMAYQVLFAVLFGTGMYGIISTTFQECDVTSHALVECSGSDGGTKQVS
jgi:hypothetical protein